MYEEDGFTLVEMLITLTITGVIGTALVSLLVGQTRFYDRTDDQRTAELTASATFDLFSAEMRRAGGPDLLAAEADSITIRFDVLKAVVCAVPAVDEATIYVYDRTTNVGVTGSFVGVAASSPYSADFTYADDWNPTPTATGLGPKGDCLAAGIPGTGANGDYMTLPGWSTNMGGAPPVGSVVRGYGKVTYKLASSTFFEARSALWRGTQELMGPFGDDAVFSYVMADGSEQSSVGSSDFDDVVGVRLVATSLGEGSNPHGIVRPMDFTVYFRN